jgi:hypothetical protein
LKSIYGIFTNDSIGVPEVVSVKLVLSINYLGIPTKPWSNTTVGNFFSEGYGTILHLKGW